MKKGDFILLFLGIITAVLLLLIRGSDGTRGSILEVYVNNELYGTYDLNISRDIVIENGDCRNVILIENNNAIMKEASCNNANCIKQGAICNSGDSVVCLPNRVVMLIKGYDEESGIDAVTQ